MSNKKLFERASGRLFVPRFSRGNNKASSYLNDQNYKGEDNNIFKNTNLSSTSSFRYGDKPHLVSTQQLRVDWSKFENHTFFHSAVANVNESFDRVVNFYPFEGSEKEIEIFEDGLTGYEKHILDQFPKNVGYLNFSGTVVGESLGNGTQISVNDKRGTSINGISNRSDGAPVLDPKKAPFSIEMFIRPSAEANDNQIILQKYSSLSNHFTLALSQSASTTECELHFGITSGSNFLSVSGSINKGTFSHITAFYDSLSDQRLKLLINDNIFSSSFSKKFSNLNYSANNLTIGSGNTSRINGTVFTPRTTFSGSIDDLRYFHSVETVKNIKKRKYRSFYPSDLDPTLKLYYRFNEPDGIYDGNNIILDSSGNSLHEKIINFNISNRQTGSDQPVLSEDLYRNPVLFPTFDTIKKLNSRLLVSASLYDSYNPNIITKLIPTHYFQEGTNFREFNEELDRLGRGFHTFSNNTPGSKQSELLGPQMLIKLLLTYAKFFDELKLMIDGITSIHHVEYEEYDTTPDVFLKEKAKHSNTTLPEMFTAGDIAQYLKGIDLADNKATAVRSLNQIQNLVWRRMLSEAPKMKLHKGTVFSIKSIFRQAGIEPDNILAFREYGGSKEKSLKSSRELKRDVYRFLSFTGSYGKITSTIDSLGYPTNVEIPKIKSGFLSGSRIQVGKPFIQGTFVNKTRSNPHGISNNTSDGLLTSGSFTYEALYDWEQGFSGDKESLVRMHLTGTSSPASKEAPIVNLVASDSSLNLYIRNNNSVSAKTHQLFLTGVNVFDKNVWYVSFGRTAGHDISSTNYSSYFLRAAKQLNGDIIEHYSTASIFENSTSAYYFINKADNYNASGSFLVIGSQSFQAGGSNLFLNGDTSNVPADAKITNFHGLLANARFFSKNTTRKEYLNRARNYDSFGVNDPSINYSFTNLETGSFERLILNTDAKQGTQTTDASGNIRLFDFSQNNFHFEGSNFKSSTNVMKNIRVDFEVLSDKFDLNYTREKVRVRSFQDADNLEQSYFATTPPVYEVLPFEESLDDNRLSLDMSVMRGLNENILRMFNNFDPLDDALGRPNLIFGASYTELRHLREVYFNNVLEALDLQKYRDLFKWIDNSFTDAIYSVVPRTTNFLGVNFIYESNILERNRFKYLYDEIYMKSGERDGNRGNIFLSQFVAKVKKY